jgi:hypothetical protein
VLTWTPTGTSLPTDDSDSMTDIAEVVVTRCEVVWKMETKETFEEERVVRDLLLSLLSVVPGDGSHNTSPDCRLYTPGSPISRCGTRCIIPAENRRKPGLSDVVITPVISSTPPCIQPTHRANESRPVPVPTIQDLAKHPYRLRLTSKCCPRVRRNKPIKAHELPVDLVGQPRKLILRHDPKIDRRP